jgi:Tfp pilus assembly protein PilN
MVDLFLTLGGILLVGIVAKVGVGLVFGWQIESAVTGRQRTE